jgi:hypothetical protein
MANQFQIRTKPASRLVGGLALIASAWLSLVLVPAHAASGLGRTPVAQQPDSRPTPHHDQDDRWGGRGRPNSVRPDHPHLPPRPVVVVPPCKRGGHGITPC